MGAAVTGISLVIAACLGGDGHPQAARPLSRRRWPSTVMRRRPSPSVSG